jgi:CheY-like chemotaxis protein
MQEQARQCHVALVLEPPPESLPVYGDGLRLEQVVWNLLSNAIKFTPRGGQVQIVLAASEGEAEISVSDTGEGIAAEFLPHVFDRLRQADASITRKHGGLGLGLSIVRHLVELHGGTVSARSPGQGRGATFTVRLPTSPTPRADEDAPIVRAAERARALGPIEMPSLQGVRTLVVDDDPDARDLIARILRQCGAEVTVVGAAGEAYDALSATRPDVLLSDIGMPGEDGYSLIRRVRALPEQLGGSTPAIALTAFARREDAERAIVEGFHRHVAKPADPAELACAVAQVMGMSCKNNGGSGNAVTQESRQG